MTRPPNIADDPLDEILRGIIKLGPNFHGAGTLSPQALQAIRLRAPELQIRHSVETGSGASTLLLSHLSPQHTVFALDRGTGSVSNVLRSPLLRPNVVTFVQGPTQRTLPGYRFVEKLQLVLIDGPHGYPFPDMEYYFLYPHLDTGGLLIIDDIHIRSIHNLFDFVRQDAMFEVDEVIRNTAFFRRTEAATFDPLGDGWWLQNYNAEAADPARLRAVWKEWVLRLLPGPMRRQLSRFRRKLRSWL